MIKEAIAKVVQGKDLSENEMMEVIDQITNGEATPAQIGAFMVGLRMKEESVDEITGAARIMRQKSTSIPVASENTSRGSNGSMSNHEEIVDTCGTGGDGSGTFNISTTAAFVVAGAGLKVAKHGGRSASSICGSADVAEALGLNLDLTPEQVGKCIDTIGIGFLYAPSLHSAMRHVIGPRKEIGLRTIFNVLGPLTNPAGATSQVIGVYREELTDTIARVLNRLGCKSAFVVHGLDGHDEISITGPTKIARLAQGRITHETITPEDMGMERARNEDIQGGDPEQNAAIVSAVLEGEKGARRNIVLLNAAAAIVAAGAAETMEEGIVAASRSIDSGRAMEKLQNLIEAGKNFALQADACVERKGAER